MINFFDVINVLKKRSHGSVSNLLNTIRIKYCEMADIDNHRDSRVFMHMGCSTGTICAAHDIIDLEKENIYGLICHEIGHIISIENVELISHLDPPQFADAEIMADFTIEELFGIRIYYDANKIQTCELEN